MKQMLVLAGAWVLLVGSNCGSNGGEVLPGSCDQLYAAAPGYQLCEETEDSCIFFRSTRGMPGEPEFSCAALCASVGALCRDAWDTVQANACTVSEGNQIGCMENATDSTCDCGAGELDLGGDCLTNEGCDPEASPLGAFCCLDEAQCGPNLEQCVEDCSTFSSGGEVGMAEGALCQDNTECASTLFCCLVPDAAGNCDFNLDQSCTCRTPVAQ